MGESLEVMVKSGILTSSDNAAASGICYIDQETNGKFPVWIARTGETLFLTEEQFDICDS